MCCYGSQNRNIIACCFFFTLKYSKCINAKCTSMQKSKYGNVKCTRYELNTRSVCSDTAMTTKSNTTCSVQKHDNININILRNNGHTDSISERVGVKVIGAATQHHQLVTYNTHYTVTYWYRPTCIINSNPLSLL